MSIEERIAYWIDIAEYDLETARAMLNAKRYLYVGFMCHQVIEKILKAYYWNFIGEEPPFIHNLTILAKIPVYSKPWNPDKKILWIFLNR